MKEQIVVTIHWRTDDGREIKIVETVDHDGTMSAEAVNAPVVRVKARFRAAMNTRGA